MAYDRFDPRNDRYDRPDSARYGRERWTGGDNRARSRDDRDEDRGFFERAGDEIASWFGDDEAERRREPDRITGERNDRYDSDRDFGSRDRGRFTGSSETFRERGRERFEPRARSFFGDRVYRPESDWEREPRQSFERYDNRSSFFGSQRDTDPHYRTIRQRHLDELDRDYDQYRQENQARFESDFGSWRQQRMRKRGLLGQVREHMDVVGNDDEHVGTVDRVAGDRIILAKSDPDSGGTHHSLMCTSIDRIEGDKVILDCSADQAKSMWRDESRSRALFERDDQGEAGPHALNRSFEGTYRS